MRRHASKSAHEQMKELGGGPFSPSCKAVLNYLCALEGGEIDCDGEAQRLNGERKLVAKRRKFFRIELCPRHSAQEISCLKSLQMIGCLVKNARDDFEAVLMFSEVFDG